MSPPSSTPCTLAEVPTGLEGFRLWPGLLNAEAQASLRDAVMAGVVASGGFYRPVTPGGRPFSVRMGNLGPLGWVSDRAGYRYQATHPVTERPWTETPPDLIALWRRLTDREDAPDACLVNLYDADARMGLHQDKDEADMGAPVVSVSLGDTAVFRYGPAKDSGKGEGGTRSLRLASGDVCLFGGPARLMRHGIDRILPGSSRLLAEGGRLNLTLRKAV